jgi:hypothetical protein
VKFLAIISKRHVAPDRLAYAAAERTKYGSQIWTNAFDDLFCRLRPFGQQRKAAVLKTELIQRVAGLKLHPRLVDAEKIVNTIIEEITCDGAG